MKLNNESFCFLASDAVRSSNTHVHFTLKDRFRFHHERLAPTAFSLHIIGNVLTLIIAFT